MKGKKATRRSFIISLIIHGIIFVFLALYIFKVPEKVEEVLDLSFFEPAQLPKPRPRQPYIPRVLPEPIPTTDELTFTTETVKAQAPAPRGTLSAGPARSSVKPATVTKFSNQRIMQGVRNPSLEAAAKATSQVATDAKINQIADVSLGEPSSVPGESTAGSGLLGDQTRVGGSGGKGSGLGRGNFGGGGGGKGGIDGKATTGLASLTKMTGSDSMGSALKDVAISVSLGDLPVAPLPRGEPGGRIIGKGKDIKAVLRFVRIKHRLSDWWADPTALTALVNWLNTKTEIRADMNVEGGSIELTNPTLMKAPLAIMTGHDPAIIRQNKARYNKVAPTPVDARLTQTERVALRKYLVEKGGLLFYDDCGLNSRNWPLMQTLISELRDVMPEYPAMPIPNDHELYTCFYELGGPSWGVASIWRHGPKGPILKQLKGISIGDDLAVILSHRDYLCGAKTGSEHAGKQHRITGSYQILTNAAVYALTHGKISDYSNYVLDMPESYLPQNTPITPPATPNMNEE